MMDHKRYNIQVAGDKQLGERVGREEREEEIGTQDFITEE